ncbi:CaiB/BaiF CoA transferase family protein [Desulfoferula mesophila]|uniref:Formyl-CoA transferase n=1 Tax=Desulfoferula mesophila TaxID=3058419 RepID=A0AAU9F1D9_9BACT|nr:formyl-CoA transferase [Desulfoferula mesophilus]
MENVASNGPLHGIKVLDFAHVLSAPYTTMLLGDLGAEVLKVEKPGMGDGLRNSPPLQKGESSYYFCANRNKKCIAVDLKRPDGVELIKGMMGEFDVLVENFRPGVMDRLGLGYEAAKAIRPDVIYASLNAFGEHGPYRDKPGFELIVQALTGVVSVTSPEGGPPAKVQIQMVDLCGGMFLCIAILGALFHRQRTGEGQRVNTSLYEATVAMMTNLVGIALMGAKVPTGMRTRNPQLFPSQAFKTSDGHIAVVCTPDHWSRFCGALGKEEWIKHPQYGNVRWRVENYDQMEQLVEQVTITKSTEQWRQLLEAAQVACGPLNRVEDMFADPQFKALDLVTEMMHTVAGKIKILRPPFSLSQTPARVRLPPPALGEHTRQVLEEMGLSQEQIERLVDEGIVQTL